MSFARTATDRGEGPRSARHTQHARTQQQQHHNASYSRSNGPRTPTAGARGAAASPASPTAGAVMGAVLRPTRATMLKLLGPQASALAPSTNCAVCSVDAEGHSDYNTRHAVSHAGCGGGGALSPTASRRMPSRLAGTARSKRLAAKQRLAASKSTALERTAALLVSPTAKNDDRIFEMQSEASELQHTQPCSTHHPSISLLHDDATLQTRHCRKSDMAMPLIQQSKAFI